MDSYFILIFLFHLQNNLYVFHRYKFTSLRIHARSHPHHSTQHSPATFSDTNPPGTAPIPDIGSNSLSSHSTFLLYVATRPQDIGPPATAAEVSGAAVVGCIPAAERGRTPNASAARFQKHVVRLDVAVSQRRLHAVHRLDAGAHLQAQ